MPRNPRHKNIIQIFRILIAERKKVDLFLIRREWIEAAKNNGLSELYADNFRRCLTVTGYLEETGESGIYRCVKTIPYSKQYQNIRNEVTEINKKLREEAIRKNELLNIKT